MDSHFSDAQLNTLAALTNSCAIHSCAAAAHVTTPDTHWTGGLLEKIVDGAGFALVHKIDLLEIVLSTHELAEDDADALADLRAIAERLTYRAVTISREVA